MDTTKKHITIDTSDPVSTAPIPLLVPRFWLLIAKTVLLKWKNRRLTDTTYKQYLTEFYSRSENEFLEVYEDAFQAIRSVVIELAAPRSNDLILDVATGAGYQAAAFADLGYRTVGSDYVQDRVMLAQEQYMNPCITWCAADAAQLPFANGSFDIVTVSLALHDMPLEAYMAALAELRRVSRRSVIIVEPCAPQSRFWKPIFTWLSGVLDESMYISSYLQRDIETHLLEAGLRIRTGQQCYYNLLKIYECQPC